MAHRRSGIFITLEGGEGTGKSTLMRALADVLQSRGQSVLTTREPGGTPLAENIRNLGLHPPEGKPFSPLAQALLMNAARQDHLEKRIRPALNEGAVVLCDRFSDSTRVYQGFAGDVPMDWLMQMERSVLRDTAPDLTFVLDLPIEQAAARRVQRGVNDVFEARAADFHEAVRQGFLAIARAEPHRCVILDASQPADEMVAQALRVLEARWPVPGIGMRA